MRLVNNTPIPTETLREIVRTICPPGVTGFDIQAGVTKGCSLRGVAYPSGHSCHDRANWFIRAFVGPASLFPRKAEASGRKGGYLPIPWLASQTEAMVYLLAHELRHLWQGRVPRGRRVWGSRGQYSERDACAYGIRMLRQWRASH